MINTFLLPVLALYIFLSCEKDKSVKAATYYFEFPTIHREEDSISLGIDSVDIINLERDLIYRFSYFNQEILVDYFKKGEETWDSVRFIPKYRFLYAQVGQRKGYYTDSGYKVFQQPMDVDSFLLTKGFAMDSMFMPLNYMLKDSLYNSKEGTLFKKYAIVNKPGHDYPDTINYWFSREFEDFPFTISPTMEKRNGMKLDRVVFWFAPLEYWGRSIGERRLIIGIVRNDKKYSREQVVQMLKELKPAAVAD